ncbi:MULTISPECIES: DUF1294 domain-containing protein [unclassified Methanoregula]|uniref:DUF1294 domain-containing protein n=1 Tax=unclassified Methanoregula TaxID=2649730 RepID=UPI0009CB1A44|nr:MULTISPECIES: DUF1294 domain-containing protein [unclassified Methanoregula]OPX62009.1 MAG: hypothetical protein A4E33_02607 [Methanoregula sp. PtaB.Bin085]OPY34316.1 MAG: hypothetical protein A4E34_01360 [Methanoregula sp. PtaU1.Bin006]
MVVSLSGIFPLLYTGLNILAFLAFALDKFSAKMKAYRSTENSLLGAAAIGPWGALAAMILFRHKNRHVKFLLVPFLCILHLFLFFWLWPGASV